MDNSTPVVPTPTPTIVPVSPPQAPPSVPAPSLKIQILPALLTILILALVSVASYFGYQNLPAVKVDRLVRDCLAKGGSLGESYPPQCFAITPTPATNPTSDWETYSSDVYRFEFRYPPHFDLEEIAQSSDPLIELTWKSEDNQYPEFVFQLTSEVREGEERESIILGEDIQANKVVRYTGGGKQTVVYFEKEGLTYYFSFIGDQDQQIFQILSTFKFVP